MRFIFFVLALACATVAPAQTPPDPARTQAIENWRALARLDLDAAYGLLRDNHPAMAAELGDAEFIARVEQAYAQAQTRIGEVQGYGSYRAMLAAFGNAAGDEHVGAGFVLTREYTIWPGFLTRSVGDDIFVMRPEANAGTPADGARLVSCDGKPAQDLARERIGAFYANWNIEAQRAAQTWRLLVNDRNPWAPMPLACTFENNGTTSEVTLDWQWSTYDQVAPLIARTQRIAHSGHGMRRLENGAYWISMEHMDERAEPTLAAALAARRELQAAPYVVVDVRGNGGGSSSYGDRLADILLGRARGSDDGGVSAWRVSPGNAAAMHSFADDVRSNADLYNWANESALELDRAVSANQRFTPALPRRAPRTPAFADPPGGAIGSTRVFILTDYACFSSCLLMTDTFKSRGAAQIGLPTNAATRYMESRQIVLPSSLATFSTLQKVVMGSPYQIGPYLPVVPFEGDVADTAALERWIATLAPRR